MAKHQQSRPNVKRPEVDDQARDVNRPSSGDCGCTLVRTLDVFGPAEVFGDANRLRGGDPAYKITIISACAEGLVPSYTEKPLYADQTFLQFRGNIDTLLVAGSVGHMRYEADFLDWLRDQSAKARRFGSICTSALMLAKAGLLDGRRATTHWNWCSELARDYPRVKVDLECLRLPRRISS